MSAVVKVADPYGKGCELGHARALAWQADPARGDPAAGGTLKNHVFELAKRMAAARGAEARDCARGEIVGFCYGVECPEHAQACLVAARRRDESPAAPVEDAPAMAGKVDRQTDGEQCPSTAPAASPTRAAIGALFGEIAAMAEDLRALLSEHGDAADALDHPTRALVRQIGAFADQAADAFGHAQMNGGFEEWLLSPVAYDALATVRGVA